MSAHAWIMLVILLAINWGAAFLVIHKIVQSENN